MPSEVRVLIVDDDPVSRRVLGQALQKAGLAFVALGSGGEALAWLQANTASLVLLDLMMPPPDGYAVLEALRSDPARADLPVVVLTALEADDEVSRAFEMGADDFVRKPFKAAELVARIRSQLRMRGYVDALARRERDARVVLELVQTLSSTLDFRSILYTVVRRIAEVAHVDRCSIVLVRDDGRLGLVVAASDDRDLRDLPIDLGKYPEIGRVLETGEPYVTFDMATDPMFDLVRTSLPEGGFRSLACLPILHDDKPMGVLFLRSRAVQQPAAHELWVARTVASATAIALRNARIMQTLREQTRESTYARFEAERRIRALEPYEEFFRASADGIVVVGRQGAVLFSNPRAREITGRSEQELADLPFSEIVAPDDRALFTETVEALFSATHAGGAPVTVDLGMVGGPPLVTTRTGPIAGPGPTGRILGASFVAVPEDDALLMSFRDVTDERITERELTETKEFLERVIESSVDAIISADTRGRVLIFNRAAERIFGFAASEVVGVRDVRTLYPEGVASSIMALMRAGEQGGAGRLEGHRTEVITRSGERVPVEVSAALIVQGGKTIGSVGIMTDMRGHLRMQASLDAAEEELRTREKQALIAELAGAAAHELNQPLTSVLGYAEIIRRRAQAGQPHLREMEALAAEAERMADIVRKIGQITRYETKNYVGEARIIDLERSGSEERGAETET